MDNKHEEFGQELVDVVRPSESKALEDWTQHVDDIKETAESSQNTTTQSTFVTTSIQPIRTTSPSTTTKEESTTTSNSRTDDFPILGLPRTQIVAPTPIAAAAAANKPATTTTAAEDEATFTLPPPSPPTPVPESNMTTTDTLSLLETEQQHPLDTQQQQQPDIQLTESTAPKSPDVLPADTLTTDFQVSNNKRTSVAATMAQSILGDRLDDFTEKLAFIKKNIIMSLEDEENWDEDDRVLKPSLSESNKRR